MSLFFLDFYLFAQYCGQRCGYVPTTSDLFFWLFEYAMYEFEMHLAHPFGASLWGVAQAAIEIEGGANGYHHSLLQVWFQTIHEYLLLWCAKGYPNDVCSVLFYCLCNAFVIELVNGAKGEFHECHAGYVGVLFCEILLQCVEYFLPCAQEYHSVFAGTYNIHENVASAIVAAVVSVNPFYEFWYPAAVAYGKDASVDDGAVLFVVVYHGEYVAVGYADVACLAVVYMLVNGCVHRWYVEFVSDVEVFFHFRNSSFFLIYANLIFI